MDDFLSKCHDAVVSGDSEAAEMLAQEAIGNEAPLLDVIEEGFVKGIREVGRLWEEGTYFLPELVMGAEAVKKAMSILNPALAARQVERTAKGVIVIGTVQGDIHDIGKTLVATMLSASGFEVHDLGTDITPERFVEEAEAKNADIIGASALLTTTMRVQERIVLELEERGSRKSVMFIVGGAPCSLSWAEEIGADGYARDAVTAVGLAEKLVGER